MPEQVGWAFAVSAGRRRDYTVIAAPDFMIDAGAHGALADVAAPTASGLPARVTTVRAAGGRWSLAYRTKIVDGDDLTRSAETGGPEPDASRLLDEHGRPLSLIYGFVCGQDITSVDASDLERAHRSVRAALTALLGEEDTFRSRRTAAFPLRSGLRPPPSEPASAVTLEMPVTGTRRRHAHRAEGPAPVAARRGSGRTVRRPLVLAVAAGALLLGGGTALAGRYLSTGGGGEPLPAQVSSNQAAQLPGYVPPPPEPEQPGTGSACCRIGPR